jgi:hypothetical protein
VNPFASVVQNCSLSGNRVARLDDPMVAGGNDLAEHNQAFTNRQLVGID